jgi:hypothetical protein
MFDFRCDIVKKAKHQSNKFCDIMEEALSAKFQIAIRPKSVSYKAKEKIYNKNKNIKNHYLFKHSVYF